MKSTQLGRPLPDPIRGVYLLLADKTQPIVNLKGETVMADADADWIPQVGKWIQQFNVVFFTFLDESLIVPKSYKYTINNRNNIFAPGTKIIFSMGGESYSSGEKWDWLTTKEKAESKAEWIHTNQDYDTCDGIDFDLEPGLYDGVIHFLRKLRTLKPNWIITVPINGGQRSEGNNQSGKFTAIACTWPAVAYEQNQYLKPLFSMCATSDQYLNLIDTIGIMQYNNDSSLQWIQAWNRDDGNKLCDFCGCKSYGDCLSACTVPQDKILVGLPGDARQDIIDKYVTLSTDKNQSLSNRGYMVWQASADNGFTYSNADARISNRNWLGSKKGFFSCKQKGSGCELDPNCTEVNESKGCYSDIEKCNTAQNCSPIYSCKSQSTGCQKDPKCTEVNESKGCYSDVSICNKKQNCSPPQPPPPKCKSYQSGTYPNCEDPSCASLPKSNTGKSDTGKSDTGKSDTGKIKWGFSILLLTGIFSLVLSFVFKKTLKPIYFWSLMSISIILILLSIFLKK